MPFDTIGLMTNMSTEQRVLFASQLAQTQKNRTTGLLLALFLGGVGAHKFYMGKTGQGVLYLIFCWTFLPALVALVEVFLMGGRIDRYNERAATDLAGRILTLAGPSQSSA